MVFHRGTQLKDEKIGHLQKYCESLAVFHLQYSWSDVCDGAAVSRATDIKGKMVPKLTAVVLILALGLSSTVSARRLLFNVGMALLGVSSVKTHPKLSGLEVC